MVQSREDYYLETPVWELLTIIRSEVFSHWLLQKKHPASVLVSSSDTSLKLNKHFRTIQNNSKRRKRDKKYLDNIVMSSHVILVDDRVVVYGETHL